MKNSFLLLSLAFLWSIRAGPLQRRQSSQSGNVAACSGYTASNVTDGDNRLTATLTLSGTPCNAFSTDIESLNLLVEYQTDNRLHVKITDANSNRYEVPGEAIYKDPTISDSSKSSSNIYFNYTASPFSFTIHRKDTNETLFDSSIAPLIYEDQYLRLTTSLPENPSVYGLGEHTDSFQLATNNYTRTLWSRDAFGVPNNTNLYGNHPIYYEVRDTGSHGVFLLNSNGMDIKLNQTNGTQTLEYNTIGGVLDLYFFAGPSPIAVAQQYANLVGLPAMPPYWSFGFHNCRYGYIDYLEVAQVILNYSAANIPLETAWIDIDYMFERQVFTNDPQYFPLAQTRDIARYLHEHDQNFIVMTDPAVATRPGPNGTTDTAYSRGLEQDIFLKYPNGSIYRGVVWGGPSVFPDWTNPATQDFWNSEINNFYSADSGFDVDGLWIDMNEPSNFLPFGESVEDGPTAMENPPNRTTAPPPIENPFPESSSSNSSVQKRSMWEWLELQKRQDVTNQTEQNLLTPGYTIQNAAGSLSNKTSDVRVVHANGELEYNMHNLYGSMMSNTTRTALINRRPGRRPLVITRSTFAGAGNFTGKWLGDNLSTWALYRNSIQGMLQFASLYQVPMVGSDICGFGDNTTLTLCQRWIALGAFYPFSRVHNNYGERPQELYRWPELAETGRQVLGIRMKMLDYLYTNMWIQSQTGSPAILPLSFIYPEDANVRAIDLQFFFGPSVLVSPVTEENSTSVTFYVPQDTFYEYPSLNQVNGTGLNVTLDNVDYNTIPVHIKGGSVLALRNDTANTTTSLRRLPFDVIVAPDANGTAFGHLYLDDGDSLEQSGTTFINLNFSNQTLSMNGTFEYNENLNINSFTFLGVDSERRVLINGQSTEPMILYNGTSRALSATVSNLQFRDGLQITIA